jgi:hypothetical protein
MTRVLWGLMMASLVGLAGRAEAQAVYVPNQWEDRPRTEIGATVTLVSPPGTNAGAIGLRVTQRINPWVSVEVGADRRERQRYGPSPSVLAAAVRLSIPFEPRRRSPHSITDGPGSVFVTLGAARALDLPWRTSPVVGLGVQSPYAGEVLAIRFEYQRFTRGYTPDLIHRRLMMSAVVGLKSS